MTLSGRWIITGFLLLPFLMLFNYIPVPGWYSIGNDYIMFSPQEQLTLLFSLKKGSFPLYVPGYWMGQSSAALTLGQLYHPITWLAALIPGYWNGYALLIMTVLRMLTLGVAHLFLWRFFCLLRVRPAWAFICSFIAVYNLRMLDMFRYGASLEAYTGMIFTCIALGYTWLYPHNRRILFLLAASLYWLLTSGHPQMAYYAMIGCLIFAVFCPFICAARLSQPSPNRNALIFYYLRFGGCMVLALLLAAAYLIPFYADFMQTNGGRMGQDYSWSVVYIDHVIGSIGSFFFPLGSDVHGNFGGSALLALAIFIPLLRDRRRALLWALWLTGLVMFLVVLANHTPVHKWLWDILPFASSMRVPGKMALLMPLFIGLLLLLWDPLEGRHRRDTWAMAAAAVLYSLYSSYILFFYRPGPYVPMALHPEIAFSISFIAQVLGLASLIALLIWVRLPDRPGAALSTGLLVGLQTLAVLSIGTWIADAKPSPTYDYMVERTREHPDFSDKPAPYAMATHDAEQYLTRLELYKGFVPAAMLSKYFRPPLATLHTEYAFNPDPDNLFKYLDRKPPESPVLTMEGNPPPSESNGQTTKRPVIRLVYNNFNRLVFEISASAPSYVKLNYPLNPHWHLWVNGKPATAYRGDGIYLTFFVLGGNSRAELRYWSDAQCAGIAISCLAFALLGMVLAYQSLRGFKRHAACLSAILLAGGGFWLWYATLYSGESIKTAFEWKPGMAMEEHFRHLY